LGVLLITFRDIPEASRQGKGEKDALWQAADCKEVRRMLDPRHHTKLPRIEEALEVFGMRRVVSVEEAA
jgi:hypothetical protein